MTSLPLDGITVVAMEQAVAMPLATRHLVDLGARVIKIEHPSRGDLARGYDDVVLGTGAHFVWLNRGKESLAIDVASPTGRRVVRALVSRADVFVQNLGPGAARRLGFDARTLRAADPRLVVVDLSGYGQGGPDEERKAYDLVVQAESGLISLTGTPEEPVKAGIPVADIASGMYCAQAVLAALLRQARLGTGAAIEVTMLEATLEWMGHAVHTQLATGQAPPRMVVGHGSICPYGTYPTSDGKELLIGVQSDAGWRTLARDVLEDPELADDPRLATNQLRVEHRALCDASVAARTVRWNLAELDARLRLARVPAARISTLEESLAHPQLAARARWRDIATENGVVPALLPPITFDDVDAAMGPVPALGSHTASLLREAGLDQDEVRAAIARGDAVQAPPVVRPIEAGHHA